MQKGKVKWFSDAKGYGFIVADDPPHQDVFFHFSAIEMDSHFKTIKQDEEVYFELTEGKKGPTALNVTRVGE